MRQIKTTYTAIERFHENGKLHTINWVNELGKMDAPGDLPSEYRFYPSGNLRELCWYQNDWLHRGDDKPAIIEFKDTPDKALLRVMWYKNGYEHRTPSLPSHISFDENSDRICLLQFCTCGEQYELNGIPGYIWINPDGTLEDEDGLALHLDIQQLTEDTKHRVNLDISNFIQP